MQVHSRSGWPHWFVAVVFAFISVFGRKGLERHRTGTGKNLGEGEVFKNVQKGPQSNGQNANHSSIRGIFPQKKLWSEVFWKLVFKICLIFQASSVFESSFVRILSVWIFPVLICLFYWYLNLCLAREFTLRVNGIFLFWSCPCFCSLTSAFRFSLLASALLSKVAVRLPSTHPPLPCFCG